MSRYEFENFDLPEFSSGEVTGGKLFPRQDADHGRTVKSRDTGPGVVQEKDSKYAGVFETDFATEKAGDGEKVNFETQFATKADAKSLMENAKREAAETIENAKREVARIEKKAYEKGYHAGKEVGFKESREEGVQKLLPCLDAFEKSLKENAACRTLTYKNCEAEMLELLNTLSRRVIHRELGRSNEFILDVIREAMKEIAQQEEITVRLNSEDLDYAESFKPELLKEIGSIRNVLVEKDDSITRGGCVIKSNFGEIDSRVESKIHEIEKVILEKKPKKEAYKTPDDL